MLATHVDAEQRYSRLRREALAVASEVLKDAGDARRRLSEINPEALFASKAWADSAQRVKDWDWIEGYSVFKFRYPKRFEVAVWDMDRLIGLSMGRPTYQGTALRLDVVEAAPADLGNRPGIFDAVLLGYGVYARLVNAREIRIMHPVNERVKDYYERFGYEYMAAGDYLRKEVL